MTQSTRATPLIWGLLIFLGILWGASFLSVKVALTGFGPLTVAAIRISTAALILTLFARATGRSFPRPRDGWRIWIHIFGFGMFSNVLPFALLSWGQLRVTSGFAGITMAVVPLLVLPLAHVFVPSERMSLGKLVGFIAGFIGVAILIGPAAWAARGGDLEGLARLACIAAACCYAIGSIITRTAPPAGMVTYAAGALLLASMVIVPYALVSEGLPSAPPAQAFVAITYLAIGPTALATLIMVHIIRNAGSSFLSLVNYQVPVWSVVFGATLMGEAFPAQFIGALALILSGLAISQFGAKLFARKRPAP